MLDTLLARAADADHQTIHERVAALNVASRIAGGVRNDFPPPPSGWRWQGDRLVQAEPQPLVPLRRIARDVAPVDDDEDTPDIPQVPSSPGQPSRRQKLLEMVQHPDGATLDALLAETALDVTSIRALISIARRKGVAISFDRETRRYFVAEPA